MPGIAALIIGMPWIIDLLRCVRMPVGVAGLHRVGTPGVGRVAGDRLWLVVVRVGVRLAVLRFIEGSLDPLTQILADGASEKLRKDERDEISDDI